MQLIRPAPLAEMAGATATSILMIGGAGGESFHCGNAAVFGGGGQYERISRLQGLPPGFYFQKAEPVDATGSTQSACLRLAGG